MAARRLLSRRSVLYMPANNERALAKLASLRCDVAILDLEDAVAPAGKLAARAAALDALAGGSLGSAEVVVRVNALSTPWGADDLAAVAEAPTLPSAVVLPKVDGLSCVEAAARALEGSPAANLPLWTMIETPLSVINAPSIAAHNRVECLVAGFEDLKLALHARATADRLPLLHAMGAIVMAARSVPGVMCLDGVFPQFKDVDGLRAEAEQGQAMGFDGKTIIHPSNIDVVNGVWTPAEDEVDRCRRMIEAADAQDNSGGVFLFEGKMAEELHVAAARRTVAMAETIEARA